MNQLMSVPGGCCCGCGDGSRGAVQALGARLADLLASAGVLVVGGDVADASRGGRVGARRRARPGRGRFEVGVLGFEVPEEALDPGLVCGGAGTSEALGDC